MIVDAGGASGIKIDIISDLFSVCSVYDRTLLWSWALHLLSIRNGNRWKFGTPADSPEVQSSYSLFEKDCCCPRFNDRYGRCHKSFQNKILVRSISDGS
jgi:hypothetical protein